jgi:hypothetical protein
MSWILTYLMVGVLMLWLYDRATQKFNAEYHFNKKERIMAGLSWPVFLVMFTYYFIKTFLSGKY